MVGQILAYTNVNQVKWIVWSLHNKGWFLVQNYFVKVSKIFSPSCDTRSHFHNILKKLTISKVGLQSSMLHQLLLERAKGNKFLSTWWNLNEGEKLPLCNYSTTRSINCCSIPLPRTKEMTNHYYNFVRSKAQPFLALRWSYLSRFKRSAPHFSPGIINWSGTSCGTRVGIRRHFILFYCQCGTNQLPLIVGQ